LAAEAERRGIAVFRGNFFRGPFGRVNLRCIRETQRAIRDFNPDLVHCHGGRAAFFRSFVWDDCPTVYTVHGLHFAKKDNQFARVLGRAGESWSSWNKQHLIYVCGHDADLARSEGVLAKRANSSIIYNGILLPPFRSPRERTVDFDIGFVGRLVYQKHPELFLDVVERFPQARAVIAGGGTLSDELQTACRQRGLDNRVTMLGRLSNSETITLLQRIKVLVMTSRWEGLPILPLEAMAIGVPVVSTGVGGMPEIIEHGRSGFLSPSSAPAELAGCVELLLNQPSLYDEVVRQGRRRVEENFSQEKMLADVSAVYRNLANVRSGHRAARRVEVSVT
jgi:glycosyltransferase involved in cell wall biosynthesis